MNTTLSGVIPERVKDNNFSLENLEAAKFSTKYNAFLTETIFKNSFSNFS